VSFNGITGHLGRIINADTKNVTIDDTAWRDGRVVLTEGWNMLERTSSNWIDTVCSLILESVENELNMNRYSLIRSSRPQERIIMDRFLGLKMLIRGVLFGFMGLQFGYMG